MNIVEISHLLVKQNGYGKSYRALVRRVGRSWRVAKKRGFRTATGALQYASALKNRYNRLMEKSNGNNA